ncbi:hypothetical protein [Desulfofustis limnaeus]|uniref:DUF5610 domain-containing protein n=1 Tax=Desulfofustis limnaeus TaxID=2740163 RepID=A0ABM7W8R2_9BACT|nr:hypothetical protein [Desulfofustis limnaeus]BDD87359.1 hypothetical protein DPPLL_17240 [Desulfofustis limnaeus]
MAQSINTNYPAYGAHAAHNRTNGSAGAPAGGTKNEPTTFSGDQVQLSSSTKQESGLYTITGELDSASTAALDLLRSFVVELFRQQGLDITVATGEEEIDLAALSEEEAQALVAEDGYFGVEQTSDRIVDFAIGIAGGDPSRLDAILAGVEQGFNEALEAFGGWLPDISYQTYDAVLAKLDAWANGEQQAS